MLVVAHLCFACAACAVIWFVQLVHYPLYAEIDADHFAQYHAGHLKRARWMLAPVFLGECALAIGLVAWVDVAQARWAWGGLVAYGLGMVLTVTTIEACYRRLNRGFDVDAWRGLLRWNWARVVLWSARVGVALVLVHREVM